MLRQIADMPLPPESLRRPVDLGPRADLTARLFRGLGVAAVDLSAGQIARLRERPEVVDVVENDRRQVRWSAGAASVDAPWGLDATRAGAWGGPPGTGIRVAVLGTGVDPSHPQLAGHFDDPACSVSFVPGADPIDRHGFGTHASGVVAGRGSPRIGVAPGCSLLSAKVLADDGAGYDEWILAGLQWAVERKARIVVLAAASGRGLDQECAAAYERVASTLLAESPGCLILAPTGDGSARPAGLAPVDDPAACPSIPAVTAVNRRGGVASFANTELDFARVAFAGPGVDVLSAWPGGGLRALSGTAVAAAHAAGVAALIWSASPSWTAREVLGEMRRRALPLESRGDCGVGLVRV